MSERLVGAALIALLALATLGEGGGAPDALLGIHVAIGALVLVALAGGRGPAATRRLAGAPATAFAAFATLALAGAVFAPYAYDAFAWLQELAAFLAVAWLAARVGPDLVRRGWPWLAAVGLAHAADVLVLRFAFGRSRPAGTFFNTNHLAAWLVAVALIAAATWTRRPDRAALARRAAVVLPLLAAVAITGSRGGLLALAAGTSWIVLRSWRGMHRRERFAVVGVAVLVAAAGGATLAERFRTPDPFPNQRPEIWRATLSAVARSPWLGVGPGQFPSAAQRLQFPDPVGPARFDRTFRATHSDWLRPAAELGIPGLLVALAGVAAAAAAIRRGRPEAPPDPRVGAVAALVALLAQASVENLSNRPAVTLLAAALLGALLSRPGAPARRGGSTFRALGAALVVVALVVGDLGPWAAWRTSRALPAGELSRGDRETLLRAIAWNPLQPYLRMREAEAIAAVAGYGVEAYAGARDSAEHALRLNPVDGELWRRAARLEARGCLALFRDSASRARAATLYRRAEVLEPTVPFVSLELGEFLLRTSDFRGALAAADRALELEPAMVPAYLLRAAALVEIGGTGARESAASALAEAERVARDHAAEPRENGYVRQLLRLDRYRVEELRRRLGEAGPGAAAPVRSE